MGRRLQRYKGSVNEKKIKSEKRKVVQRFGVEMQDKGWVEKETRRGNTS